MQLMTCQTGHYRLLAQAGIPQSPRPLRVGCRNQVANPSGEMHSMTAQAIVSEVLPAVMGFIQKDFPEGYAMRPGCPIRVLLLMTSAAARRDLLHITELEPHLFRNVAA